jgi:hypothetical protein
MARQSADWGGEVHKEPMSLDTEIGYEYAQSYVRLVLPRRGKIVDGLEFSVDS